MISPVDDWVAVEVKTDAGRSGFFVTWGRIQDSADPQRLEELTLPQACLGGRTV